MSRITARILRSEPQPHWQEYTVETFPQMVVLDVVERVREEQDETLAYRFACRLGMCGTCGMTVNGRPRLACRTPVASLGDTVTIAPMRHLPVIRDLAVDMDPFFEKYRRVKPWFVPKDAAAPPAVLRKGSKERGLIDQNLECITCGLCTAACGMLSWDPGFLGPAALNRAHNLIADVRDAAAEERLALVDAQDGIWRCHTQFECTEVCPKRISPSETIGRLKRVTAARGLRRLLRIGGGGR